ncbi:MAG TPA: hypothetical protein VMV68_02040 [Spirochaetia bacterium]|nr:hypothetical protein [Spirochaetia bacterium]
MKALLVLKAGGGWAIERRTESAARLRLYEQVTAKITEAHLTEILAIADRAERRAWPDGQ